MPDPNTEAIAKYTKRLQEDPEFARAIADAVLAVQKGEKPTDEILSRMNLTTVDLGIADDSLSSRVSDDFSTTVTTATTATFTSPTTVTTATTTTTTAVGKGIADLGRPQF